MLWMIAVVFALLWVVGLATSHRLGGLIHVLAIVAAVLLLVRIVQGSGVSPYARGVPQLAQPAAAIRADAHAPDDTPATRGSRLWHLLFGLTVFFTSIAVVGANVSLGTVASTRLPRAALPGVAGQPALVSPPPRAAEGEQPGPAAELAGERRDQGGEVGQQPGAAVSGREVVPSHRSSPRTRVRGVAVRVRQLQRTPLIAGHRC